MSIEPIRGKGANRAKVICDECGRDDVVACDYARGSKGEWIPNEGQIQKKIVGAKWSIIKGRMICPGCEAKRKAEAVAQKREAVMADAKQTIVTDLRQPTREQKRQIMAMLEASYDTASGRYTGGDTDKTVAEAIGGGVMPGWVSEIREEFFGPDGGNDDMRVVACELKEAMKVFTELRGENERVTETARRIENDMRQQKERLDRAISRIEAIKAAVGPKAARA